MKRYLFHLLLCFSTIFNLFSANNATQEWANRYNFTALTMNDGVPNNFIDDIIADSRGFIWIATLCEGVARYDGYNFITFNMASERTKLKSNFVRSICEDDFGRIWAGSEMGVDVIDVQDLSAVQLPSFEGRFIPFSHLPVHYIYKSKKGNLWLASTNQLYKITFAEKGDIKQILKVYELSDKQGEIVTICETDDAILFNNKTSVFAIKEDIEQFSDNQIALVELPYGQNSIKTMYKKDNELWIGTLYGLYRYNLATKAMRLYQHSSWDKSSLSQDCITHIIETDDNFLLIATLKGLNVYNNTTDSFERINRDKVMDDHQYSHISNTLNCDFINCMLSYGNTIWIGTEVGGINKITKRKLFVENYTNSPLSEHTLSKNPVNAIFEDENGTLWVGTVEGGLNRKAKGESFFTHYTVDAPSRLSHNSVSCFATDGSNRLWVGTWGGGIGWVDKRDNAPRLFHHVLSEGIGDFSYGLVGFIAYDKINEVLWVGTANGIYTYNPTTGEVTEPLPVLGGIEGSLGYCIDSNNQLWIGLSTGLARIELNTLHAPRMLYQLWHSKLDDPNSELRERVSYIAESGDGTIWVGSNGYGLYRSYFNEEGEYCFKAYKTDDGLVNNSVRGIREDKKGNIWIATINGLSCMNPMTENFANYTEKDGLACSQFYWNGIAMGSEDDLYLGSVNGLTVVYPEVYTHNREDIPLAFTHVRVADKEAQLQNNRLEFHERDKSLYIEFAALDYNESEFSAYSYRLKDFEDKWINVSHNRRAAAFTNLKPGTYSFELRYAPDGKDWMAHTEELHIVVKPYFYKTMWFICLATILLLIIVYQVWNWRIRSLKAQQEMLQRKVEERTSELEEQKQLLTLKTDELSRQNKLLMQQNEKITNQKAQILKMSKKVQDLTVDKLAFFTNITHEFRTPITLIIGPIERALKLSVNPQVIEQLGFVERNSRYLLSLVNQLMDFRKVESGNMDILLKGGDLQKLLDEIITPFKAFATDKGIELKSFIRLPKQQLMFDEDAMRKIMTNLISNALKFTPRGGVICVFVTTLMHKGNASLFIAVKDNGSGIAEEDRIKIFNRFYQSRSQQQVSLAGQSGTGIGLYLCKRIIQLHGGTISVKNNRVCGCAFRIALPLHISNEANLDDIYDKYLPLAQKEDVDKLPAMAMTILVVEDNRDMRDYISSILREHYNIMEAANGQEALDLLRKHPIDFIISDLMMPIMDGLELSRQVKADFTLSHLPFLMLTAKTSEESRLEGYRNGVDEYLLKPFDENLLLARINNLLENRKRLQQKFTISMEVDALNIDCESGDKKFLDKAMQVVKGNFQNSYWEVSDFIEEMGVSKSLVNKKMQSLTGQSAGQFIRNYRLNIARELIGRNTKSKGMNISEIAYEVGFNDPKYFTRCFTKHFGSTPSSLLEN